jgi:hypothetical protein
LAAAGASVIAEPAWTPWNSLKLPAVHASLPRVCPCSPTRVGRRTTAVTGADLTKPPSASVATCKVFGDVLVLAPAVMPIVAVR